MIAPNNTLVWDGEDHAAPQLCVGLLYMDFMKKYIVHIVVDDKLGEKLRELPYGEPAWVVDSPSNMKIIKELWDIRPNEDHTEGITSFKYDVSDSPESRFMDILESILVHHGQSSHDPPCSKVNVIGAKLTDQIKNYLLEYDFTIFEITDFGFMAEMAGQPFASRER